MPFNTGAIVEIRVNEEWVFGTILNYDPEDGKHYVQLLTSSEVVILGGNEIRATRDNFIEKEVKSGLLNAVEEILGYIPRRLTRSVSLTQKKLQSAIHTPEINQIYFDSFHETSSEQVNYGATQKIHMNKLFKENEIDGVNSLDKHSKISYNQKRQSHFTRRYSISDFQSWLDNHRDLSKSQTISGCERLQVDLRPFASECSVQGCTKLSKYRCSQCGDSYYCSRSHQQLYWSTHEPNCSCSNNFISSKKFLFSKNSFQGDHAESKDSNLAKRKAELDFLTNSSSDSLYKIEWSKKENNSTLQKKVGFTDDNSIGTSSNLRQTKLIASAKDDLGLTYQKKDMKNRDNNGTLSPSLLQVEPNLQYLEELMQLGFAEHLVRKALEISGNDVERAANWLLFDSSGYESGPTKPVTGFSDSEGIRVYSSPEEIRDMMDLSGVPPQRTSSPNQFIGVVPVGMTRIVSVDGNDDPNDVPIAQSRILNDNFSRDGKLIARFQNREIGGGAAKIEFYLTNEQSIRLVIFPISIWDEMEGYLDPFQNEEVLLTQNDHVLDIESEKIEEIFGQSFHDYFLEHGEELSLCAKLVELLQVEDKNSLTTNLDLENQSIYLLRSSTGVLLCRSFARIRQEKDDDLKTFPGDDIQNEEITEEDFKNPKVITSTTDIDTFEAFDNTQENLPVSDWECEFCTLINPADLLYCDACGEKRNLTTKVNQKPVQSSHGGSCTCSEFKSKGYCSHLPPAEELTDFNEDIKEINEIHGS